MSLGVVVTATPSGRAFPEATRAVRPAWAWTPTGLERAPILCWNRDGVLTPHRGEPVEDIGGIVLPGLINAHTHLELGPMNVPPGLGLPAWVRCLKASVTPSEVLAGRGVVALMAAGTAAVVDVGNAAVAAGPAEAAGLRGRLLHEVLGIETVELPVPPRSPSGAALRPTPHAPFSTSAELIRACAALPGRWSIHFDEDAAERELLGAGTGPWADYARSLGRDPRRIPAAGMRPAPYLDQLGVLTPHTLLVHATLTRGEDLDLLAARGVTVVLCIRSNLFISGRLPDVPGMVARGIPLALGTDSLASTPDLDPIAEAAAAARAFPELPAELWLRLLTSGGADAADLALGRLEEGATPGLLHVAIPDGPAPLGRLLDGTRWPRRWLSLPARVRR